MIKSKKYYFKNNYGSEYENTLVNDSSRESKQSQISIRSKSNIMIICGPNGAPFECLAKSTQLIEFYLNNDIHVFLWNYRGFGESEGSPSFEV